MSPWLKTHDTYFKGVDMQQIVQWFDLGGEIQLADTASAAEAVALSCAAFRD